MNANINKIAGKYKYLLSDFIPVSSLELSDKILTNHPECLQACLELKNVPNLSFIKKGKRVKVFEKISK